MIYSIFFLSGAAGLGYQLIWTKMFTAGLGHEMPALIAVVGAFFGGLACGAWLLDRPISASPNPRRWFGGLEMLIGAWGMATALLIPWVNQRALEWIGGGSSPSRQGIIAFVVSFVTLLPATMAMGATLPAMERWLALFMPNGRCLGTVYALNTLGAVAGTLGSAFLLLPALGLRASSLVFAAINLLCGSMALALSMNRSASSPALRAPSPPLGAGERGQFMGSKREPRDSLPRFLRPPIVLFFTGLLGIGFEVVVVRVLAGVLEGTIYTYAAVVAVYLMGTAFGAALYQKWGARWPIDSLLVFLLCAITAGCLAGTWFLERAPTLYEWCRARLGDSIGAVLASEMAVAFFVFGWATVAMGATFSHLVQSWECRHPAGAPGKSSGSQQSARRSDGGVGRAAAANTLGGALAGGLFGILLLPLIGAKWTLVLISYGYLLLLPRMTRSTWRLWVLAAFFFALPADLQLVKVPPGGRVLNYREGIMASVAVVEDRGGGRTLRVNNRWQMGGTSAAQAERRQAQIPLLLHPSPKRALFLGPGTGITLGAASLQKELRIDGVELLPEVIDAMGFFTDWNFDAAHRPNVLLHAADARRFVRISPDHYDVIVADLFHPAQDGAGFLYTREHFQAVRNRLEAGGLFCQWLPLHQLDEATLRVIIRTFLDVFSETRAVLLHFNVDIPVLGLVGTEKPLRLPPDWLERRTITPKERELLRDLGLDRTINLFGCLAAGPAALRRFAEGAEPGTDDYPSVNFTAPRFTVRRTVHPEQLLLSFLKRAEARPEDLLAAATTGETEPFRNHLMDFLAARDIYLQGLADEGTAPFDKVVESYLESARRSLYFTPAYARCLTIIETLARTDGAAARRLFKRLEQAQPAQPLGRKLLGPLLAEPP